MPTSYYPIGLTAVGDNTAASGHVLGLYVIPADDIAITGITFDSPTSQLIDCRAYAIGGSGGGDGNPIWTQLNVPVVSGINEIEFPDLITLTAGLRYAFAIALEDDGHFKSVSNGGAPLDGDFTTVNEHWGIRVLDTDTLPATATMAVSLAAPWDQVPNFYGVGLYYGSLPSKISFSATRVDNETVSIDWSLPGDAPDGISICRASGPVVNDGEGRPPSDAAYDPSTVDGAVIIAEGLSEGPYLDEGLTPGVYTYWVARFAPIEE